MIQHLCAAKPGSWLTLTGGVGIGKSAIAIEAARTWALGYDARALYLPMQGVATREQLVSAFAGILHLGSPQTIRSNRAPVSRLITDHLRSMKTVLVLDGCQKLNAEAILQLLRFLESGSYALATSYTPLSVPHEIIHQVGPLDREKMLDLLLLRLAEGSRKSPVKASELSALIDLCDGVPQIIEVAVAMSDSFPPEQLSGAIMQPREGDHRGLPWLIANSLARVSTDGKEVFYQISIFEGAFRVRDAEAILSSSDVAARLTELEFWGLLSEVAGQEGLYQMQTAFRAYARLQAPKESCEEAYIRYYADLAEAHGRDLAALGPHVANIKNALDLALASGERFTCDAARIAMNLPTYWVTNRALEEATEVLSTVAEMRAFNSLAPSIRAGVLGNLGVMHLYRGQYAKTVSACELGLPAARLAGDVSRLGAIASNLAVALMRLDRELESLPYHEEAVIALRALGDPERLATALQNASAAHIVAKSYESALNFAEEGEAVAVNDHTRLRCRSNRSEALFGQGRIPEAEGMALFTARNGIELGDYNVAALCLTCIGLIRRDESLVRAAFSYHQSVGDSPTTFATREIQTLGFNIVASPVSREEAACHLAETILTL